MIDTLLKQRSNFKKTEIWDQLNLKEKEFIIITLHRPGNVDDAEKLQQLLTEITINANNLPLIFPIHPRTKKIFDTLNIQIPNLHVIEPLGYLEFNYLVEKAKLIITDSGGITEETTVLGVPCITLRENTERPETVNEGTNELIGTDPKNIQPALKKLFDGNWKKGSIPKNWDGKTAERIVNIVVNITY